MILAYKLMEYRRLKTFIRIKNIQLQTNRNKSWGGEVDKFLMLKLEAKSARLRHTKVGRRSLSGSLLNTLFKSLPGF